MSNPAAPAPPPGRPGWRAAQTRVRRPPGPPQPRLEQSDYACDQGSARGVDDLYTAVAGPAVLVGIGADRALLAVADHGELGARATVGLQGRGNRVAAALAQAEVVVTAAALVGVAFHGDPRGRTVAQVLGVAGHLGLELRPQGVLVEIEVHHPLAQAGVGVQVLRAEYAGGGRGLGGRGRRGRRRWRLFLDLAGAAHEGNAQRGGNDDTASGLHLVDPVG